VLIAVDNSQSMQLIGAAEYAREALTMIWKALAQLEVGDVGVIKFGDKHGRSKANKLSSSKASKLSWRCWSLQVRRQARSLAYMQ